MIKKIATEQLRPGMFIHDLNCGWMEHPFMHNRFKIESHAEIEKITQIGIREVYIDTELGLDVKDAQTEEDVRAEIHDKMVKVAQAHPVRPRPRPVKEELVAAKQVHHEANQAVHSIMTDIRVGKQIEIEQINPVVERITDSILRNRDALISLGRIKERDNYTFQHSVNVCALLVSFSNALDFEPATIREVGIGGLLHDIGKMKVPLSILNKPGPLTEKEFEAMKSHAALGRDILRETPNIPDNAIMVAGQHHERYDGTGYPDQLKSEEISRFGQMAAIVDVYDALTSNRVYHKGEEPTGVLRKLYEWSKFHFDMELVQHFIRTIGIYPIGSLVSLESGRLAVVVEQGQESLLRPIVRVIFDLKQGFKITPKNIDLSQPVGKGGADRIVGYELPEKWKLNPFDYL
jgi:putative nucleotidyltransferase with HDIG domain